MTDYPLGILLARGVITQDEHDAGQRFAWLHAMALGRDTVGLQPEELTGIPDEEAEAHAAAMYRALKADLLRSGRRVADAVENVCCYNRLPRWALLTHLRASNWRDCMALGIGLDKLVERLIRSRRQHRPAAPAA